MDLAGLPETLARLAPGRLAAPPGDTDRSRHGTGDAAPSPSPAWDEIDAATRWAVDCEDRLRAHLGHSEIPGHRRSLDQAVAYLRAHATAWLCTPWAVDDGLDAIRWARRLTQATGTERLVHRLETPCPRCHVMALTRDDGDEWVECRNPRCGAGWDLDRYEELIHAVAATVRRRR